MSTNKFLYKYRGVSGKTKSGDRILDLNINNIINNEFYAANKEELNDPNEFYVDDDNLVKFYKNIDRIYSDALVLNEYSLISKKDLEKIVGEEIGLIKIPKSIRKTYRKTRTVDSEEFYTGVRKAIKKIEDLYNMLMNKKEQLGVFSLTDRPDNELMWAHYAESHKGFLIQYDYNSIAKDKDFFKIEYKISPPRLGILDLINSDNLVLKLAGIKSKEWEYESEYRLIKLTGGTNPFYEKQTIKGIYFGANMEENIKEYIYERLQELDLEFFKMRPKKGSYKLETIPYKE